MKLNEISELCKDKIIETGAARNGYHFAGWTREMRTYGRTWFHSKEIKLSKALLPLQPPDLILDTILHECAHALLDKPGHGKAWQEIAASIGAKPVALQPGVSVPAKWLLVCTACGWSWDRQRRTNVAGKYHCDIHAALTYYPANSDG